MNTSPDIFAFIVLFLTVFPVIYKETKSEPSSPFFVSRFYSLLKRLAWGVFFNGVFTYFGMAFLQTHTKTSQEVQGALALLQLTVVPILLAIWAYRNPRVYQKKPTILFPLLLGLLLLIDYWLTMALLVSAAWAILPVSLAI